MRETAVEQEGRMESRLMSQGEVQTGEMRLETAQQSAPAIRPVSVDPSMVAVLL